MKLRTRIAACSFAVAFATSSMSAHADWIGDFYSAAGAGANVTAPQAIASQSVTGFAGGGLTWRVPNKNFQPFQISPPSLKMGCNGIDAFLGSYSFVNMDQFVTALRNFGQAAVGYFFELALRTMAPEIAVTLDVINDIAMRVNSMTVNNCQAAKAAVDAVAGPMFEGMRTDAANSARAFGTQVDNFISNEYFKSDFGKTAAENYARKMGKAPASVTKTDIGKFDPVNVNVLYWALRHANPVAMTDEEIELVMSLVGPSLIIGPAPSADDPSEQNYHSSGKNKTIDFEHLVGENVIHGTVIPNIIVLKCAGGTSNSVKTEHECLDLVETTEGFLSFSSRVMQAIARIKQNIASKTYTPFDPEHETVLKLASVPIYRAAALSEGTGFAASVADQLLPDLAEYAAVDAGTRFVNHYLGAAEKALSTIEAKIPAHMTGRFQLMVNRIADIKADMRNKTSLFYQNKGNPYQKIEQLERVERAMYSNLNIMLAANARFAKRQ